MSCWVLSEVIFWPKWSFCNRASSRFFMHMKTHFSTVSFYLNLQINNFFKTARLICISVSLYIARRRGFWFGQCITIWKKYTNYTVSVSTSFYWAAQTRLTVVKDLLIDWLIAILINDTAPTDMVLREGGVGLFIELLNLVMYHICKQSGRTEGLSSGGGLPVRFS